MTACVGDFDPDQYTWSCTANRDCGAGLRCQAGTCVRLGAVGDTTDTSDDTADTTDADRDDDTQSLVDTTPAPRLTCVATRAATGLEGGASFSLDPSSERPRLNVRIDTLEAAFDFPADVELVTSETGPLLSCCEQSCCLRPD